jgi:hypothetical protein
MGFIDAGQLAELAEPLAKSSYGQYLKQLLNETQREGGEGRELSGSPHVDTSLGIMS